MEDNKMQRTRNKILDSEGRPVEGVVGVVEEMGLNDAAVDGYAAAWQHHRVPHQRRHQRVCIVLITYTCKTKSTKNCKNSKKLNSSP